MPFSDSSSVQRIRFTEDTGGIFGKKTGKRKDWALTEKEGSTKQRLESSRSKQMRTEENDVTTVDELVSPISQEATHTHTHIVQHAGYPERQSIIIGIIHCNAFLKCLFRLPKCLLPIVVSFSYIYISQGIIATQLRCGGIFNNRVIPNVPQNVTVKECLKSVY